MDNVHRLEAPEQKPGGLFIKKKENSDKNDVFKVPISKFGLDVLARKLKKERESGLLTSFRDHDDETEAKVDSEESKHDDAKFKGKSETKNKNYRTSKTETPSHPGGVSRSVRDHYRDRISDKSKGIYASTKDKDRKSHKSSNRDRDRDRERKRSRYDRNDRSDRERSDYRKDRSSYRRRDEPETPREHGRYSVGKTSWDDDDEEEYLRNKKKRSSWDFPTPDIPYKGRLDDSVRSYRSVKAATTSKRVEDDTPRPTPAHKYNKWAADRKNSGATPRVDKSSESKQPWNNEEDRDLWEEEQVRLDREWYNMDEGYDDENNPFTNASAEYLKKREEQIELKKRKRISAQQRQINKDNELWEKNRMITSGVVTSINVNEDFEEETVDRVHLLVHHTIPPFLDGRIVFTKVMGEFFYYTISEQCLNFLFLLEPVIPVKDPTSDMAITARKGSALVRVFREQKERRKAQKKHWELSGTKLGNIMGVEKKKDDEDGKFDADTDTADYRKDQKFAEHMTNNDQSASSDFAKRKTILQQRRYLPVFAVRQDLLNVIRENSVVIIVGVSFFQAFIFYNS